MTDRVADDSTPERHDADAPGPGSGEDVADNAGLGVRVVVHVMPLLLGEPPLLRGVKLAVVDVDTKPVAQVEVVTNLGTVRPLALVLQPENFDGARRREAVKLICRMSTCSAARSQGGAKLPTGGKCEPARSPRALPGFV